MNTFFDDEFAQKILLQARCCVVNEESKVQVECNLIFTVRVCPSQHCASSGHV